MYIITTIMILMILTILNIIPLASRGDRHVDDDEHLDDDAVREPSGRRLVRGGERALRLVRACLAGPVRKPLLRRLPARGRVQPRLRLSERDKWGQH